jgi:thiamine transport system permease protein
VQLPLGLSLVTFALGLFDLAPSEIPRVVVVVLVQSFLAFPFVYRILDTTFRDLDPSLLDVAATLGAGSFDIVKLIYFPLVRPGVASALAFAIAIPFADFTGVLVVGRGRIVTFPIAIYRLLGFRNFDSALALGTLYMALLFVVFFLVNGTERRQPGESTRFI